ncbi:hypothetical protein [Methylobacterium bullatum]|uniref:Uncharacterized protein n=1 Tax=Methylobacterium bullatum TaxID=570505 RepID=A0AAV4ZBP2_9HYPH|nr:hypothetical protein [Methylobacterium bullatum]MBD8902801.1 hypothetical protein [Methylobacterium bullatum]GJD41291.1 hypothetical protein OICFNHDK_3774 [Methylobacterium bullatum]
MATQKRIWPTMLVGGVVGACAFLAAAYFGTPSAIRQFNGGYALASSAPYVHPLLIWIAVSVAASIAYDLAFESR